MADPPQTDEGWYVLHDFRRVDWDAWREAPDRERDRAVDEGASFLADREAVTDAEAGESAVFSVLGHEADLLLVHFRPTLDHLSAIERRFEDTALAAVTEQVDSYVSVTEVSGYVSQAYFEGDEVDAGLERYIRAKLQPEIPEDAYVSFYPMSKRRGEEYNWYDLPFEERAEMMAGHGDTGKEYAGRITQVIASSVGLDDHEWGVTLFADDPTDLKDIVYEMRFDEATAMYGEFGGFRVGRRFPPSDLGAFLAGEGVPTAEGSVDWGEAGDASRAAAGGHHGAEEGHHGDAGGHHGVEEGHHGDAGGHHGAEEGHHGDAGGHHGAGDTEGGEDTADAGDIRGELADLDVYAGQPHGEDVYATVLYSEAAVDDLVEEVDGLRANFDHYDPHVRTAVYDGRETDRRAVVSIWDTASAAETAAGFLSELPGVVAPAGDQESGFGTMGMFYTVDPDHREEFIAKFDEIGGLLAEMDGHVETDLMVNVADENDTFIASQWASREDAMEFFRSEAFADTVDWGRDVLVDRPRHVFLA